jgi:pyruvate kinase
MADITLVNGQITDAITQSNLSVLGSAPSQALANLAQVAAQATGLMLQNAVTAQQSLNTINAAVIAKAVTMIEQGDGIPGLMAAR